MLRARSLIYPSLLAIIACGGGTASSAPGGRPEPTSAEQTLTDLFNLTQLYQRMGRLAGFPIDTDFAIGDRDLATNLFRTGRLLQGWGLSLVTAAIEGAEATNGFVEAPTAQPLRGAPPPGSLAAEEARRAAEADADGVPADLVQPADGREGGF